MVELPTGTVTHLFTDLESSTPLWEQHPEAMAGALARHDALVRAPLDRHGGALVKTTGDGFHAAFSTAAAALAAALDAQRALSAEPWDPGPALRVRMGLHTGSAELREGDYYGASVNRAARIMAAAHGGQVLLSAATEELVRDSLPEDVSLLDLGEHRLKDLARPERLFQLAAPGLPEGFPALRARDARPNNLPAPAAPLVGREAEVAEVISLLRRPGVRLVTLVGPGGIGKTRLGLQAAAGLLDDFPDGVYFVALAPVADPALACSAIGAALGVREAGGRPLEAVMAAYLHDKRLLLLLDNLEQVLSVGPRLGELLADCPSVKLLATSREPLRISGEQEYPVPALALPDPRRLPPIDRLTQYESVRFFIDRARAVRPGFEVTSGTARAVAEICVRLDGLPLAIELAAARIRLFTPEALLGRLDRRLQVLTGGARDLPARQQTLRGAIGWSYDLLPESEARLFRRMAVFPGGATLESIEAVCGGEVGADAWEGIDSLVSKSLLQRAEDAGEPRFRMLETVREFAGEALEGSGEAGAMRERHARHFVATVEALERRLHGPEQVEVLDQFEREHDNIRAALEWSRGPGGDPAAGLRLVAATFWQLRGHLTEGERQSEAALAAAPGRTQERGRAVIALGQLKNYLRLDRPELTIAALAEATDVCRDVGDRWGEAYSRVYQSQAMLNHAQGAADAPETGRARAMIEESVRQFRELRDPWGLAMALWVRASFEMMDPEGERSAKTTLDESVRLFREIGDPWGLLCPIQRLDSALVAGGDRAAALAHSEEAREIARRIGDRWKEAWALNTLSRHLSDLGRADEAARYREEAARLYESIGIRWQV